MQRSPGGTGLIESPVLTGTWYPECRAILSGSEKPPGAVLDPEAGAHLRGAWDRGIEGAGAHILSAEVVNDIGIGQDVPCQLLLLFSSLEDQAPLAEADDVLFHQVQVYRLHELLGR